MYIAFKWLVALALTMWLAMCFVDLLLRDDKLTSSVGVEKKSFEYIFKNNSPSKEYKTEPLLSSAYNTTGYDAAGLHFIMFIAGALVVSVFHKKQEIITFTGRRIAHNTISKLIQKRTENFTTLTRPFLAVLTKYVQCYWVECKIISYKIFSFLRMIKLTHSAQEKKVYISLLKRLKEMGEDRKNLGQLLIEAIRENKKIRMRFQLEIMAKNRLLQNIEDTQKQIKENRCKYVSFQQLYLVTHQENTFLKARIKKLKDEKAEVQNNLMQLLNEVYRPTDKELKAQCAGRFIVKRSRNLLNSDVGAEIQKFLEKSRNRNYDFKTSRKSNINVSTAQSWPKCTSPRITQILNEDDKPLLPLVSEAPKLKGLPGECVWTIKDKNGIIEKLYEYDYGSEFDNGDTIRRIRQYSVYFDKDCLLDFSNSTTEDEIGTTARSSIQSVNFPLVTHRIVTGSEAFQNFLLNNRCILPPRPPGVMLCE